MLHTRWTLLEMRKDALQRGLPAPDEAYARHHCLHQGVEAPDLATMKDFFRFAGIEPSRLRTIVFVTSQRVANVLRSTTNLIRQMVAVKVLCVLRNIRPASF